MPSFATSLFRIISRLARRPSRLTLAIVAGIVAVAAGLASSAAPALAAASSPSPVPPAVAIPAGQGRIPVFDASIFGAPSVRAPSGPASHAGHPRPAARAHQLDHPRVQAHQVADRPSGHTPPPAPAPPYQIYDSVTPGAIPAGHVVATYATGGYAVQPSQVAGRKVLWIDTRGTDPAASVLDVEPGDATPSQAATWASQRLSANPHAHAIIYTMISQWGAAQASIATLPAHMRAQVRWWIADPTGSPHLVPGSDATQWYWGPSFDISTASPGL
jgi:hypothetical protein